MPHKTTIRTNGQTLRVNVSVSYWTTEALALTASGTNDVESTTTTTIYSDYDLWFPNTASTATVTVSTPDGTTLATYAGLQVHPGVGTRVLEPLPDRYMVAADTQRRMQFLPTGALAQTFDRNGTTTTNGGPLSSGRLTLTAIDLPAGLAVTSITFVSQTTAASAPTAQWFALYDKDRVLLRQTTDDTNTAWGSAAAKTLSLTPGPYTTTYSGLHYLGICVVASTVPTLNCVGVSTTVTNLAPILSGSSTGSLTTTAPDPAAAITVNANHPWAYVS